MPADHARASLRAIGTAYLRFAQNEPGLFRTAFAVPGDAETTTNPAKAGNSGLNPFPAAGRALDRLVEAGVLPAERRPGAEYLAWSAVHGLAMLVLEGPLRRLTRAAGARASSSACWIWSRRAYRSAGLAAISPDSYH